MCTPHPPICEALYITALLTSLPFPRLCHMEQEKEKERKGRRLLRTRPNMEGRSKLLPSGDDGRWPGTALKLQVSVPCGMRPF